MNRKRERERERERKGERECATQRYGGYEDKDCSYGLAQLTVHIMTVQQKPCRASASGETYVLRDKGIDMTHLLSLIIISIPKSLVQVIEQCLAEQFLNETNRRQTRSLVKIRQLKFVSQVQAKETFWQKSLFSFHLSFSICQWYGFQAYVYCHIQHTSVTFKPDKA